MKKIYAVCFFLLFSSSLFAEKVRFKKENNNPKEKKERSSVRNETNLVIIPTSAFHFKIGDTSESSDGGFGLAVHQSLTFRAHQYFSFGIASNVVFFFKKQPKLSDVPSRDERMPMLINILVPFRGHYALTDSIELQPYVEGGLALISMPGSGSLGLGGTFSPGVDVEFSLNTEKNVAITLGVGYSGTWTKVDAHKDNPLHGIVSLSAISYLKLEAGLSYDF